MRGLISNRINEPCKVLYSPKQTLFHPRTNKLASSSREGDSRDKIHFVNMDLGQHATRLADGDESSVSFPCLLHDLEVQGRVAKLDGFCPRCHSVAGRAMYQCWRDGASSDAGSGVIALRLCAEFGASEEIGDLGRRQGVNLLWAHCVLRDIHVHSDECL